MTNIKNTPSTIFDLGLTQLPVVLQGISYSYGLLTSNMNRKLEDRAAVDTSLQNTSVSPSYSFTSKYESPSYNQWRVPAIIGLTLGILALIAIFGGAIICVQYQDRLKKGRPAQMSGGLQEHIQAQGFRGRVLRIYGAVWWGANRMTLYSHNTSRSDKIRGVREGGDADGVQRAELGPNVNRHKLDGGQTMNGDVSGWVYW